MTRTSASIRIVDDDEAIRGLLSACFDGSYRYATAASAEEAVTLLQSRSFNLVLSIGTIARLREAWPARSRRETSRRADIRTAWWPT